MPKSRLAIILLLLTLLACAPSPDDASSGDDGSALRIVVTTGMIADLTRQIVGDRAAVDALMGPGTDPHLYKASESDVRRLAEADLILYNGLHLEGKIGDILDKMARTRPVVAVAEGIAQDRLRADQGAVDPHLWFDVALWTEVIPPIVDAVAQIAPDQAAALSARGDALRGDLMALDAWAEAALATIPRERRILVTAHDAFGYLGQRYGLEVVGLQGLSTLAEAGLDDVDRVVEQVVTRRIPAIFVESSVPTRTIEAVQQACAERGHAVAIGGELYSDAMGPAGTDAGTYVGMVRHNVRAIVAGLGGTLPADDAAADAGTP
ncbi:MAG: zinc ABC transporter substrate-binding protein [Acidobacteriota bacterium]